MENLLKNIFEQHLVKIYDKNPADWEESIHLAGEKLVEYNYIKEDYIDEIIQNVKSNGPYIVIVPGVAMPHAMAQSESVIGTAISFTKFPEFIVFDEEDTDKKAKIFFTIAAKDSDEHLANIQKLMNLLLTEGMIEKLENVQTIEDYKSLMKEEISEA